MPKSADAWWDDLRQEAEPPPPPSSRPTLAVALGVAVLLLAAVALAWWLSTPGETRFDDETAVLHPAESPVRRADAAADGEQVRRAYEEFGLVYANSGVEGVDRFAESCAESLRGDPRILDFCLAFDLFADSVRPAPPGDAAEGRRAAMTRAALPDADPAARITEVRRLMRTAAGLPAQAQAPAGRPEARSSEPARLASAEAPRRVQRAARSRGSGVCASASTRADRLTCEDPVLRIQERRMKAAYGRAIDAGANPLQVDRGQAQWRALRDAARTRDELAELYARRTRELNETAAAVRETPPS